MSATVALALRNVREKKGGPFAAMVVRNGIVVATGVNHVTLVNDPTAHAEIAAIRQACNELQTYSLSGMELYTSCEPCPMCLGAIHWARLDRVYYAASRMDAEAAGFDDAFLYREICLPIAERVLPIQQLSVDDATLPLHEWTADPNKIQY